ncbi:hypothetical protein VTL71DRAFT_5833 [Oculimacula yallundae]|uniref:Rhodopsin domain-containing protein n=1 Tax=Oculimacula yallundae TaxID=86028 RepID=A0ABR4C051_9HELO
MSSILAGIIVPTVISSCFVVARFYSRRCLSGKWAVDDSLIATSWVVSLGLAVSLCILVTFGPGHSQEPLSSADLRTAKKLAFSNRIVYQFVLCTTKLGICSFYLRIFQDKWSKRFIYALLTFILVSALVVEFAIIFSCMPVKDAWAIGDKNCLLPLPPYIGSTVLNAISDLALMAFVIPKIFVLQISRNQKIYVLSVVCLGFLVVIAGVLNLVSITRINNWGVVNVNTWKSIEVSTGLLCASAPCLQPLIRKLFPALSSSLSSTPGKATARSASGEIRTIRSRRQSMQSHKSAFIPHLKKAFSMKMKTGMEEVKLKTINAKRLSRGTFAYAIRKREDAFQESDWEDLTKGASVENWLGRVQDEEAVKEAAASVALSKGSIDISQIGTRRSGPSSFVSSG